MTSETETRRPKVLRFFYRLPNGGMMGHSIHPPELVSQLPLYRKHIAKLANLNDVEAKHLRIVGVYRGKTAKSILVQTTYDDDINAPSKRVSQLRGMIFDIHRNTKVCGGSNYTVLCGTNEDSSLTMRDGKIVVKVLDHKEQKKMYGDEIEFDPSSSDFKMRYFNQGQVVTLFRWEGDTFIVSHENMNIINDKSVYRNVNVAQLLKQMQLLDTNLLFPDGARYWPICYRFIVTSPVHLSASRLILSAVGYLSFIGYNISWWWDKETLEAMERGVHIPMDNLFKGYYPWVPSPDNIEVKEAFEKEFEYSTAGNRDEFYSFLNYAMIAVSHTSEGEVVDHDWEALLMRTTNPNVITEGRVTQNIETGRDKPFINLAKGGMTLSEADSVLRWGLDVTYGQLHDINIGTSGRDPACRIGEALILTKKEILDGRTVTLSVRLMPPDYNARRIIHDGSDMYINYLSLIKPPASKPPRMTRFARWRVSPPMPSLAECKVDETGQRSPVRPKEELVTAIREVQQRYYEMSHLEFTARDIGFERDGPPTHRELLLFSFYAADSVKKLKDSEPETRRAFLWKYTPIIVKREIQFKLADFAHVDWTNSNYWKLLIANLDNMGLNVTHLIPSYETIGQLDRLLEETYNYVSSLDTQQLLDNRHRVYPNLTPEDIGFMLNSYINELENMRTMGSFANIYWNDPQNYIQASNFLSQVQIDIGIPLGNLLMPNSYVTDIMDDYFMVMKDSYTQEEVADWKDSTSYNLYMQHIIVYSAIDNMLMAGEEMIGELESNYVSILDSDNYTYAPYIDVKCYPEKRKDDDLKSIYTFEKLFALASSTPERFNPVLESFGLNNWLEETLANLEYGIKYKPEDVNFWFIASANPSLQKQALSCYKRYKSDVIKIKELLESDPNRALTVSANMDPKYRIAFSSLVTTFRGTRDSITANAARLEEMRTETRNKIIEKIKSISPDYKQEISIKVKDEALIQDFAARAAIEGLTAESFIRVMKVVGAVTGYTSIWMTNPGAPKIYKARPVKKR